MGSALISGIEVHFGYNPTSDKFTSIAYDKHAASGIFPEGSSRDVPQAYLVGRFISNALKSNKILSPTHHGQVKIMKEQYAFFNSEKVLVNISELIRKSDFNETGYGTSCYPNEQIKFGKIGDIESFQISKGDPVSGEIIIEVNGKEYFADLVVKCNKEDITVL